MGPQQNEPYILAKSGYYLPTACLNLSETGIFPKICTKFRDYFLLQVFLSDYCNKSTIRYISFRVRLQTL